MAINFLNLRASLEEKKLTPAELKKREEVAKAIERENPNMPMGMKMAIASKTAKRVAEETKYYSLVHKATNKVLSTHKDLESAKDEHRGMDQGERAHYRIATSTKEPKTWNMKEEADDEGRMARGQLNRMINQASGLVRVMDDYKQLDGWVQSKLTMASDYLDAVHDYLMHSKQDVDRMEEELDELNQMTLQRYASKAYRVGMQGGSKSAKHLAGAQRAKEKLKYGDYSEEVEQVNEVSKKTALSYIQKKVSQIAKRPGDAMLYTTKMTGKDYSNLKKAYKRAGVKEEIEIFEGYTEDDIANGGTVIYKHQGKHYMSKVSHKTGGGAGTKIHTTSSLGHVVPLHNVVSTDASDWNTYKNRPVKEEFELDEASQFPSKEHAIKYAKEKVKTHKDSDDGIEVYSMPGGGARVVHTMNSQGRQQVLKGGGKKVTTVTREQVELDETKSAPKGFHFTKDGKLKRGDADRDGPGGPMLRSDPLDKQRSKVPPVSEEQIQEYYTVHPHEDGKPKTIGSPTKFHGSAISKALEHTKAGRTVTVNYKDHKGVVDSVTIKPGQHVKKALDGLKTERTEEAVHYCAKHVYSELFGEGQVVEGDHAEPNEAGHVEWYNVQFEHGIEKVFTEDIEIMMAEYHANHKRKKRMTNGR